MKAVLLLLLVAACSSVEDDWRTVVHRLNGELRALRPTARAIAASDGKDDPASVRSVVAMCASVDPVLDRISQTRPTLHALDREPGGPHSYMIAVPSAARALKDFRHDVCGSGDDWRCRDWCVRTWRDLARAVDELRVFAAKHGAYLETL